MPPKKQTEDTGDWFAPPEPDESDEVLEQLEVGEIVGAYGSDDNGYDDN